jgi:acetyl esterase/lipase
MGENNTLHVAARDISIPSHLSPPARAQLEMQMQGAMALPDWPELDDTGAWLALAAKQNAVSFGDMDLSQVETIAADGVTIYASLFGPAPSDDGLVYLDCHGGALIWGNGESCRAMAAIMANLVQADVWAPDYRLPPHHPYPAGLDDCVAAYKALLQIRPASKIIIGGASAGGNLAAATILRARDEGLPLPAAAVLLTPQIDLTESGDSFHTLLGIDTTLTASLMPANLMYAGGHDRTDPYVSPLFGDFGKGFPPTYLMSGTRDLFLSNAVLMHRALRRADVEAELHIFDAATHVMFMAGSEQEDFTRELRRFVHSH